MRLREIREDNNLSQFELAQALNVSRSVYGMWETEHDIIPLKRLNDFCNYFNVSFDYVLELTDIRYYPNNKSNFDRLLIKDRLKALRLSYKFTQEKLSKKLNITRSLISKYENGTNLILTSFLIEYSNFFKISADYLVGRIDEEIILKEKVLL